MKGKKVRKLTPRTTIYVAQDTAISQCEFKKFFKQYSQHTTLDKIDLCRRLNTDWSQHRDSPKRVPNTPYTVNLPTGEGLRERILRKDKGVYAIFAKHNSEKKLTCFYVGISEKDVCQRLVIHLREDIKKNYRNAFKSLKRASEILICYGTINSAKSKSQLELLERCMTVKLRPDFLLQTAK